MAEPTWLISKVDQCLALVEDRLGKEAAKHPDDMILTPLAAPEPDASEEDFVKWERTCDCCGFYADDDHDFYTGHVYRKLRGGTTVIILFGVCEAHADKTQ